MPAYEHTDKGRCSDSPRPVIVACEVSLYANRWNGMLLCPEQYQYWDPWFNWTGRKGQDKNTPFERRTFTLSCCRPYLSAWGPCRQWWDCHSFAVIWTRKKMQESGKLEQWWRVSPKVREFAQSHAYKGGEPNLTADQTAPVNYHKRIVLAMTGRMLSYIVKNFYQNMEGTGTEVCICM